MEIVIKKGTIELKFKYEDFVDCTQTYDGMSFQLKHGLQYYLIDNNMQTMTKEKIIQTINSFKNAKKITIDLFNRANPTMVELN